MPCRTDTTLCCVFVVTNFRAGTGVVVAALYYQSATKDHGHGKEKGEAPKNGGRNPTGPARVSLSGVGTAVNSSADPRDEEAAAVQPLIAVQQR